MPVPYYHVDSFTEDLFAGNPAGVCILSTFPAEATIVLGGLLGERVGLRGTVLIAGCGTLLSLPWILLPSVRSLREAPV